MSHEKINFVRQLNSFFQKNYPEVYSELDIKIIDNKKGFIIVSWNDSIFSSIYKLIDYNGLSIICNKTGFGGIQSLQVDMYPKYPSNQILHNTDFISKNISLFQKTFVEYVDSYRSRLIDNIYKKKYPSLKDKIIALEECTPLVDDTIDIIFDFIHGYKYNQFCWKFKNLNLICQKTSDYDKSVKLMNKLFEIEDIFL